MIFVTIVCDFCWHRYSIVGKYLAWLHHCNIFGFVCVCRWWYLRPEMALWQILPIHVYKIPWSHRNEPHCGSFYYLIFTIRSSFSVQFFLQFTAANWSAGAAKHETSLCFFLSFYLLLRIRYMLRKGLWLRVSYAQKGYKLSILLAKPSWFLYAQLLVSLPLQKKTKKNAL